MASSRDRGRSRRSVWRRSALLLYLSLAFSLPAHDLIGAQPLGAQRSHTTSPTRAFQDYLRSMDASREQSILAARRELLTRFSAARAEWQVEAFRIFLEFYRNVVRLCDKDVMADSNLQQVLHLITADTDFAERAANRLALAKFTTVSRELETKYRRELTELARYAECGMRFVTQEGDWYLAEDPDFLLESAAFVKGEYMDYLLFHLAESRQRLVEDAGLQVSWEELARRIFRWERFAANHPSLPDTRTTIDPEIRSMMSLYLLGTDNTAPYDFSKKGAVEPALLESYAAYARRRPDSRYATLIDTVHKSLVASHGVLSMEVLDLVRSAGFEAPRLERQVKRLLAKPPQ
jgi:hypothetical protein